MEDCGGVDEGGLYLDDVLVVGEVGAPLGFDVAFEFGAGVALCDEACFASVDLEAGPVESSAFGESDDGVVGGLGHGVFGIGLGLWGY